MEKQSGVLVAGLGALGGAVVGAALAAYVVGTHLGEKWLGMTVTGESASALLNVRILETLQANDHEKVARIVEAQLDGQLITLGSLLKSTPQFQRNEDVLAALRIVKQYRTRVPRQTSEPLVNQAIEEALSYAP